MVPELRHCIEALSACGTPGDHDTLTALSRAGRLVYKSIESVPPNFGLQCAQQFWLLHESTYHTATAFGKQKAKVLESLDNFGVGACKSGLP